MSSRKKDPRELKRQMAFHISDEERYRLRHMAQTWGITVSQMICLLVNRAYEQGSYLYGYDALTQDQRADLVLRRAHVLFIANKRADVARRRNFDRRNGLDRGLTNVMVIVAPLEANFPGVFCHRLGQVWIIPYGLFYRVRESAAVQYPCFASVLDYFGGRRIAPHEVSSFIARHRDYILSSFGEKAVLKRLFAVYGKIELSVQESRIITRAETVARERAMANLELEREYGVSDPNGQPYRSNSSAASPLDAELDALMSHISRSTQEQIDEQIRQDQKQGVSTMIDAYNDGEFEDIFAKEAAAEAARNDHFTYHEPDISSFDFSAHKPVMGEWPADIPRLKPKEPQIKRPRGRPRKERPVEPEVSAAPPQAQPVPLKNRQSYIKAVHDLLGDESMGDFSSFTGGADGTQPDDLTSAETAAAAPAPATAATDAASGSGADNPMATPAETTVPAAVDDDDSAAFDDLYEVDDLFADDAEDADADADADVDADDEDDGTAANGMASPATDMAAATSEGADDKRAALATAPQHPESAVGATLEPTTSAAAQAATAVNAADASATPSDSAAPATAAHEEKPLSAEDLQAAAPQQSLHEQMDVEAALLAAMARDSKKRSAQIVLEPEQLPDAFAHKRAEDARKATAALEALQGLEAEVAAKQKYGVRYKSFLQNPELASASGAASDAATVATIAAEIAAGTAADTAPVASESEAATTGTTPHQVSDGASSEEQALAILAQAVNAEGLAGAEAAAAQQALAALSALLQGEHAATNLNTDAPPQGTDAASTAVPATPEAAAPETSTPEPAEPASAQSQEPAAADATVTADSASRESSGGVAAKLAALAAEIADDDPVPALASASKQKKATPAATPLAAVEQVVAKQSIKRPAAAEKVALKALAAVDDTRLAAEAQAQQEAQAAEASAPSATATDSTQSAELGAKTGSSSTAPATTAQDADPQAVQSQNPAQASPEPASATASEAEATPKSAVSVAIGSNIAINNTVTTTAETPAAATEEAVQSTASDTAAGAGAVNATLVPAPEEEEVSAAKAERVLAQVPDSPVKEVLRASLGLPPSQLVPEDFKSQTLDKSKAFYEPPEGYHAYRRANSLHPKFDPYEHPEDDSAAALAAAEQITDADLPKMADPPSWRTQDAPVADSSAEVVEKLPATAKPKVKRKYHYPALKTRGSRRDSGVIDVPETMQKAAAPAKDEQRLTAMVDKLKDFAQSNPQAFPPPAKRGRPKKAVTDSAKSKAPPAASSSKKAPKKKAKATPAPSSKPSAAQDGKRSKPQATKEATKQHKPSAQQAKKPQDQAKDPQ